MKGNLVILISPNHFHLVFHLSKIPIASITKPYKNIEELENILKTFMKNNHITDKDIKNIMVVTDFTSFMKDLQECSFGYIQIGDIPNHKLKTERNLDGLKLNIYDYNIKSLEMHKNKGELLKFLNDLQKHNIKKIAINSFFSILHSYREKELIQSIRELYDDTFIIYPSYIYNIFNYMLKENTLFLDLVLFDMANHLIDHIGKTLKKLNIHAPIYFMKGNGTLTSKRIASTSPIFTWQSFFTSLLIGASTLCGEKNAFVLTKNNQGTKVGIIQNMLPKLDETFSNFKDLHIPNYFPQSTFFNATPSNNKWHNFLKYHNAFIGPVPIISFLDDLYPSSFFTHPVIKLENHPSIIAQGALNAPFQLELSSIISTCDNKVIHEEKEKLVHQSKEILHSDNIKLKSIDYIYELIPIKYIPNNASYIKLYVRGNII